MYDKKYVLDKIEEFHGHNYIYDDIEGSICFPAYLKVGERGWFLYMHDEYSYVAQRIHTSIVQKVDYFDDAIILETRNTRFTFRLV